MLKALIESMIIHDHYAQELLLSTLSSLPKNNFGDLCDSDNYRGIALTSCLNKVIDWVILLKYRDQLHTSHMQFAYKDKPFHIYVHDGIERGREILFVAERSGLLLSFRRQQGI